MYTPVLSIHLLFVHRMRTAAITCLLTAVLLGVGAVWTEAQESVGPDRDGPLAHRYVSDGGPCQTSDMQDLGTLGGSHSEALGINKCGAVVGFSELVPGSLTHHAFIWWEGVRTDLGTLGGENSVARGINDQGDIVGTAETEDGQQRAVIWTEGKIADLGPAYASAAMAINIHGQIVGQFAETQADTFHPVRWSTGVRTDLGYLPLSNSGGATAINRRGQVVGFSGVLGHFRAFLWESGVMTELEGIGGSLNFAEGVNNRGQAAGEARTPGNWEVHPVLWEEGAPTAPLDLGSLGGTNGAARAINNRGQVAGFSQTLKGFWHAFLWEAGAMTDLGTLGGNQSWAYGLNDRGQVVGFSETALGKVHAFRTQAGSTRMIASKVDGNVAARQCRKTLFFLRPDRTSKAETP